MDVYTKFMYYDNYRRDCMKELTEEEKRKITERFKAIRRGESKAEYVGIPNEFRIEEEETQKKEKLHYSLYTKK
jgi:hypothetical protein